ncbi:MAG: periplasmic heavy metal sensor [Oculatellaceae cyanobacterium bins.114]|nr:periplasmic heavy metal sensor [Oculatellaceae cyanobacterium bins.114]
MKVRYVWLLPTVLVLIQVGSTIASAQSPTLAKTTILLAQASSPSDGNTALSNSPAPPWARNLDLSSEQRSQLQTIHEQARQSGDALHQQLVAAEEQLRSLLQNSDTSIEALREQHQQVQQLRQQLDENHFEALLAERQVLTSDQLVQVIQEWRGRP